MDLLTLLSFTNPDHPIQQGGRPLFDGRREADGQTKAFSPPAAGSIPKAANVPRTVYPCTIHHNGRLGGLYTLFAESSQVQLEWKAKLEEAIALRKVVQEQNKVFEVATLSVDTFFSPTSPPNEGKWRSIDKHQQVVEVLNCHRAPSLVRAYNSFRPLVTRDDSLSIYWMALRAGVCIAI